MRKATILNTLQSSVFSLEIFESEIILDENGANKNFECWIKPSPIGAPITVSTKITPVIKDKKEVKNPKKGKCHNRFPSCLIILISNILKLYKKYYLVSYV